MLAACDGVRIKRQPQVAQNTVGRQTTDRQTTIAIPNPTLLSPFYALRNRTQFVFLFQTLLPELVFMPPSLLRMLVRNPLEGDTESHYCRFEKHGFC